MKNVNEQGTEITRKFNDCAIVPNYSLLDGHFTGYNVMRGGNWLGYSETLDGAYDIANGSAHAVA